jgi:hypothetical protein
MTKVLGLYLCLAPALFFGVGGAGLELQPWGGVVVWGFHSLAFLLYTVLVDDHGFRRGWEVCEHARRQPPGPI